MNRLLMSMLVIVVVALSGGSAQALTIGYDTSGAETGNTVAGTIFSPSSSGDIGPDGKYYLSEMSLVTNTSKTTYAEAITYIAFSVAAPGFLSATVSDMHVADASAKPLEWLSLGLIAYSGSGNPLFDCSTGSSLCSFVTGDGDDTSPTSLTIYSALAAGTQYLLRVGYGFCGCSGTYGGIQLTVAATPIPPAMLMFMSALLGIGGMAWRRHRAIGPVA